MRFFQILAAAAAVAPVSGLNILLNNDDSWASANIREFYKALKAAGHNVLLVAPVVNQSGKGGTTVFTDQKNLTSAGEFNSVASGAPSFGSDPNDNHVWYYNGTPAATTFFALDYVVPLVWGNTTKPDLLVSGPNEGWNLGGFLYTLSGTIGATYAAVERGIPAIAFSAGNSTHRGYTTVPANSTTDVATLNAQAATKLVNQLASSKASPLLPLAYGINVNIPILNSSCSTPNYVRTRLTGGAVVDGAVFNSTSGIFTFGNRYDAGVNTCINGDCSLPGETNVVASCSVSVSVFTVDYDAPNCNGAADVWPRFTPLVGNTIGNYTGGSGSGSSSSSGNSTSTRTAPTSTSTGPVLATTNAAANVKVGGAAAFGGLGLAIAMLF